MADDAHGSLFLVATPIGNLEDISARALRVLGEADVIAAEDTRAALRLCTHYDIKPRRLVSFFTGNEAARTAEILTSLEHGQRVAVISEAGTPGISDPGERLARAATAAGIRVEAVPGPVAAITALVASGLPTGRFLFVGFPPREAGPRAQLFGSLRSQSATLIFYEAPDRVAPTLEDLGRALGGDRPAVLARELTKRHEEYLRGTLDELAQRLTETPPRGECTLVVAGSQGPPEPEVDIEAELRRLLADGLGPKDAAQRLVVVTGKPRRQLYQLALSLQREAAPDPEE